MAPSDRTGSAATPGVRDAGGPRHGHVVEVHESERRGAGRRRDDELCAIVMQTMAEGVVALDADGRLVGMNRAAEEMLGWTEAELRGLEVEDLIHRRRPDGAAAPAPDGPLASVFKRHQTVRGRGDSLVRRDGRQLPVVCSATQTPSGGIVIVFSDVGEQIDERVRAEHTLDAVAWVGRVREALAEHRLELHAQPILPLRGGAAREELLLRMLGRDGDVVSAGAFLPAAEELGMICEIDGWVVAQAVRFAALGRIVHVNLSAPSLVDGQLLELLERELRSVGAPAANVIFEVPEAAFMRDLDAGDAFAAALRELGCGLVLDDFGTASGSFGYLRRLTAQALKIDVDFVRDLPSNVANQHLVQAVVALAGSVGSETIAVGVEDRETLALLREFGVDYAQGFAIRDLASVARCVVPPASQLEGRDRLVADRARLLRGRLLDYRDDQRPANGVTGPD